MKEKDLIKQIKTLKKVKPSNSQIVQIKKRVDKRTHKKKNVFVLPVPMQQIYVIGFVALIVCVAVLSLYQASFFMRNEIDTITIQLTRNPYQKAEQSLALSQKQLSQSEKNASQDTVDQLIASTVQTNSIVISMQMDGKPGLYTRQDCQKMYKEYIEYLAMLQEQLQSSKGKTTDENLRQKISQFETVVAQYHQQAITRLDLYQS